MGRFSVSKSKGVQDHDPNNKWPVYGKRNTTPRKATGASVKKPRFYTTGGASTSTAPRPQSKPIEVTYSDSDPGSDSEEEDEEKRDKPIRVTSESSSDSEEEDDEKRDKQISSSSESDSVEEDEEKRDKQSRVTLSDSDLLDCPICLEPLNFPVYQCKNGHIACSSCCSKMKNKCGNCSLQIGQIRCRAIEKIVESSKISCAYASNGCKETMPYCKKSAHEKTCHYAQQKCPLLGCEYVSSHTGLIKHIAANHPDCSKKFAYGLDILVSLNPNQKQIVLHTMYEDAVFVLNRSIDDPLGSFVNVVCCTGRASEKRRFSYQLSLQDGEMPLKLESVAENVTHWNASSLMKKIHFIPKDFVGSTGQITLKVLIRRPL